MEQGNRLGLFAKVVLAVGMLSTNGVLGADTVTVGGERPVQVHVPGSYDPTVRTPLLLFLHGLTDMPDGYEGYLKFAPLADEMGFLFARPTGTRRADGIYFWNATDVCCGTGVDDSSYLRSLIEETRGVLNVDPERIFLVGHSNGGFMAYRMACDHADLIAAVVSLSGATFKDPAMCHPQAPVHVLQVHGTADDVVLFGGGSLSRGPYPGAVETVETWARYDGCTVEPVVSDLRLDLDSISGAETSITRYTKDCGSGGSAELWTIDLGGHAPNFIPVGQTTSIAVHVVDWLLAHSNVALPEARISITPTGDSPFEFRADGSGSVAPEGTIAEYRWKLGVDGTAEGVTVTHTFDGPGRYTVSLSVIGEDRRMSLPSTEVVEVVCPSADLSPWNGGDIGTPLFPGSALKGEGDCFSICAGGYGFLLTKDQGHMISKALDGGFVLTAEVTALESPVNAGIGLMVRESLEPESAFAGIFLEVESGKIVTRSRTRTTRGRISSQKKGSVVSLPAWLRLERKGDECIASVSPEGREWSEVARTTVDLGESVFAGIASTGKDGSAASPSFQALRADLCCSLEVIPRGGSVLPGDCNVDGDLDLSDAIWLLGHLFLGTRPELPCEGGTASAPGTGDLALTDVNGDGAIDLSDVVGILSFLFRGSQGPVLGNECVPIIGCPEICER